MPDFRDRRKSIENALLRNHQRQLKRDSPTRKKRQTPEQDVVKQLLSIMRTYHWDVDVIESKGGYRNDFGVVPVKPGYSDISGNDNYGLAVYVEAKAPKCRSTIRHNQMLFLVRKIRSNAFAVVVDSAELLMEFYTTFIGLKGSIERQKYLIECLPKKHIWNRDHDKTPLFS